MGGINDILELSTNDRIILLDILYKTKKTEMDREQSNK